MGTIPIFTDRVAPSMGPQVRIDPSAAGGAMDALASGMSRVSDAMQAFGARYNEARRSAVYAEKIADYTKSAAESSDRWGQTPDRQAAQSGFDKEMADKRAALLGAVGDPMLSQALSRESATLNGMYSVRTADAAFKRESSEHAGALTTSQDTARNLAANAGNPMMRAKIIDNQVAAIRMEVAGGWISPEDGDRRERNFKNDLSVDAARADIDADPDAALKALKGDAYPDLQPDQRITLREHAEAKIHQRVVEARAAVAQAKTDARVTLAEIGEELSAGLPVAPSALDGIRRTALGSGDAMLRLHFERIDAEVRAADRLRGQSPAAVAKTVQILTAQAEKNPSAGTAAALQTARQFQSRQSSALRTDPLSWASAQGLVRIDPLALDGSDSAGVWRSRRVAAEAAAAELGHPAVYLTRAETQTLKAGLAAAKNPTAKLSLLKNVIGGLGDAADDVFRSIAPDDPVAAHAGALALAGKMSSARDALAGQAAIKAGGTKMAPKPSAVAAQYPRLNAAFGAAPGLPERVMTTARAIYAERAAAAGLTGDDADDAGEALFAKALNDAAGAGYDAEGTRYGGLVTYHGRAVVAPASIKADDFTAIVKGLSPAQLAAGSATGGGPVAGGKPWAGRMKDVWLIPAGDGRYALSLSDPGEEVSLLHDAKTGGAYILDLAKVLPWMGRPER